MVVDDEARATLVKVAAGYHDLIVMQNRKTEMMAQLLRSCLALLKSSDPRRRKQGLDALADMAELLETSNAKFS